MEEPINLNKTTREARGAASLDGLSVADALGSQFFVPDNRAHYEAQTVPAGPWPWTDDTEMACALLGHLERHGQIRQDALAQDFASGFDLYRGYGAGAGRLLRLIRDGGDWRELAGGMFQGAGSLGNGAAMRVAPLGAWFGEDIDTVVEQAVLSAEVTHMHAEGIAGAVAVAVAAAFTARGDGPGGSELLSEVLARTPSGAVRSGIESVSRLSAELDPRDVARQVGNGSDTTAADTVPFCLWVAAHHLDDYPQAFWATASAGGDIDTTCAIVGGVVSAHTGSRGIPTPWRHAREPLPRQGTDPKDLSDPEAPAGCETCAFARLDRIRPPWNCHRMYERQRFWRR